MDSIHGGHGSGVAGQVQHLPSGLALRGQISVEGAQMEIYAPNSALRFRKIICSLAVLAVLIMASSASAESATLAWDANSEADLAGYRIYYGTTSGNYSTTVDVGRVTTCTISNLAAGQTYFFAAKAYNASGTLSGYSTEVSYTVPIANASPSTPATPTGSSSGWKNVSYSFSTSATDPNGHTIQYRYDWGDGSVSSWGVANQSHAWSAAGQYGVKAQAMDSQGALSVYSAARTVSISNNAAPVANAGVDQNVVSGASVTLNGSRSSDPDDGIAAYQWRQVSGASVQLAAAQSQQAGFVCPSPTSGSVSLVFELRVSDTQGNSAVDTCTVTVTAPAVAPPQNPDGGGIGESNGSAPPVSNNGTEKRPETPVLTAPVEDEIVSLMPELKTDAFSYPNGTSTHAKTRWQVFRDDDSACVLDIETTEALTLLRIPKLTLEEGTAYFWRVQFAGGDGQASEWSDYGYFATQSTGADMNANGIPDSQEVSSAVDLDLNRVPDLQQNDIKVLSMEGTSVLVGVSIRNSPNAIAIEAAETEGLEQEVFAVGRKTGETHFGLINFRIAVAQPGDETKVKLYFSEPAPRKSKWFKYDRVTDTWTDFSEHARFSQGRRCVTLTLCDGGVGDADGVANGVIVDPSALVVVEKKKKR
jgi:hypothetical protein